MLKWKMMKRQSIRNNYLMSLLINPIKAYCLNKLNYIQQYIKVESKYT